MALIEEGELVKGHKACILCLLIPVLLYIFVLIIRPAYSRGTEECKEPKDWSGSLGNASMTSSRLGQLLDEHREWLKVVEADKKEELWLKLAGANLTGVTFPENADLTRIDLSGADLTCARLFRVKLVKARLGYAKLTSAYLVGARLIGADLGGADLTNANLQDADLTDANLDAVNLMGANLENVYMYNTLYVPNPGSSPKNLVTIVSGGLWSLRFLVTRGENKSILLPHGLSDIREVFKKAGMRTHEREVTCALKRGENAFRWEKNKGFLRNAYTFIDAGFNYILFDFTCHYGMNPGRPLVLLLLLILLFSVPYMIALRAKGRTGIWVVRPTDCLQTSVEGGKLRLNAGPYFYPPDADLQRKKRTRLYQLYRITSIGLYFSLVSAFSIGWRDLNIGNWISRIQKREYLFRATGWARTFSGLQSIMSVYLIALWALCYFGRPFE